jgi:hypothetical protein
MLRYTMVVDLESRSRRVHELDFKYDVVMLAPHTRQEFVGRYGAPNVYLTTVYLTCTLLGVRGKGEFKEARGQVFGKTFWRQVWRCMPMLIGLFCSLIGLFLGLF